MPYRSLLCGFAVLVALAAFAAQVKADVVYGNGPINGNIKGDTITSGYEVTDSFTVPASADLSSAEVGIWVNSGDVPEGVMWSIGTVPFGSDVSSGTSPLSNMLLTPTSSYGYSGTYWVYQSTFSLSGMLAADTTYYLTLQQATSQNDPLGRGSDIYWDVSNGSSSAEEFFPEGFRGSVTSESFQLFGDLSAVPEPSRSAALIGLSSMGFLGVVWRVRRC